MRNRAAPGVDTAVVDLWKREVGRLSPRNFALRLAAPEDLVRRLEIFRNLKKHRGCVNTVSFNHDGNILLSGSDDTRLILWDWQSGKIKLELHSGHNNNVFQAKFMPYTDDQCIVTSAADGQIRCTHILPHGKAETKLLAKHLGQVHKLAIEPGSPHIFYSCGEDGCVQRIDLRTGAATKLLTCQPLQRRSYMSFIHLNAIAIDPRNSNLFAVAGSDVYARLFDLRNCMFNNSRKFGQPVDFFCPHLVGDGFVGITGLAFSDQSELLVSYNDELIYLFSKNMGLGPTPHRSSPLSNEDNASERPQAYKGHRNSDTVKGVSFFGPKCEYVVSGSDCGRIFIWKKKDGELVNLLEGDRHIVNCTVSHPHTSVLASSGIEADIKIWTPKATEKRGLPINVSKVSTSRPMHLFGFESVDDESDGEYFYDDDDGVCVYEVDEEFDEDDIFTDLVDEDDSASSGEDGDDDDDDDMASDDVDGEANEEEEDCFCDPVDLSNTHDMRGNEDLDDNDDDDGEEVDDDYDDDNDDDEYDEEIISD